MALPDEPPAPLSAAELANIEAAIQVTEADRMNSEWDYKTIGVIITNDGFEFAEAVSTILNALPRLLAMAQREAALLALRGWAEAAEAWMTHALSIAEERRVLSNDVMADGRGIRAALIFALDDVAAEPREQAP